MADNEPELRAAVAAYLRAWDAWSSRGGGPSFIRDKGEEGFERLVDKMMAGDGNDGVIRQICLLFHAKHGRYPAFEDLSKGPITMYRHDSSRHI